MAIALAEPDLQVDFAAALVQLRDAYLQEALFATVKTLKIAETTANWRITRRKKTFRFWLPKG